MDCTAFLAGYSDYDDSLLPGSEEAAFRAHLETCEGCARYDRVLRKGRMMARQTAPEPSGDFLPRLQHRIQRADEPVLAPVSPAVAGGFLTLMLAAVAGLWLFGAHGGVGGVPPLRGHVHAVERPLYLPAVAAVGATDWTVARVDRRDASSYSPLVIGPPAYGAPRSVSTGWTSTTRSTLD